MAISPEYNGLPPSLYEEAPPVAVSCADPQVYTDFGVYKNVYDEWVQHRIAYRSEESRKAKTLRFAAGEPCLDDGIRNPQSLNTFGRLKATIAALVVFGMPASSVASSPPAEVTDTTAQPTLQSPFTLNTGESNAEAGSISQLSLSKVLEYLGVPGDLPWGTSDPNSRLKRYQQSTGLEPTGTLDQPTHERLKKDTTLLAMFTQVNNSEEAASPEFSVAGRVSERLGRPVTVIHISATEPGTFAFMRVDSGSPNPPGSTPDNSCDYSEPDKREEAECIVVVHANGEPDKAQLMSVFSPENLTYGAIAAMSAALLVLSVPKLRETLAETWKNFNALRASEYVPADVVNDPKHIDVRREYLKETLFAGVDTTTIDVFDKLFNVTANAAAGERERHKRDEMKQRDFDYFVPDIGPILVYHKGSRRVVGKITLGVERPQIEIVIPGMPPAFFKVRLGNATSDEDPSRLYAERIDAPPIKGDIGAAVNMGYTIRSKAYDRMVQSVSEGENFDLSNYPPHTILRNFLLTVLDMQHPTALIADLENKADTFLASNPDLSGLEGFIHQGDPYYLLHGVSWSQELATFWDDCALSGSVLAQLGTVQNPDYLVEALLRKPEITFEELDELLAEKGAEYVKGRLLLAFLETNPSPEFPGTRRTPKIDEAVDTVLDDLGIFTKDVGETIPASQLISQLIVNPNDSDAMNDLLRELNGQLPVVSMERTRGMSIALGLADYVTRENPVLDTPNRILEAMLLDATVTSVGDQGLLDRVNDTFEDEIVLYSSVHAEVIDAALQVKATQIEELLKELYAVGVPRLNYRRAALEYAHTQIISRYEEQQQEAVAETDLPPQAVAISYRLNGFKAMEKYPDADFSAVVRIAYGMTIRDLDNAFELARQAALFNGTNSRIEFMSLIQQLREMGFPNFATLQRQIDQIISDFSTNDLPPEDMKNLRRKTAEDLLAQVARELPWPDEGPASGYSLRDMIVSELLNDRKYPGAYPGANVPGSGKINESPGASAETEELLGEPPYAPEPLSQPIFVGKPPDSETRELVEGPLEHPQSTDDGLGLPLSLAEAAGMRIPPDARWEQIYELYEMTWDDALYLETHLPLFAGSPFYTPEEVGAALTERDNQRALAEVQAAAQEQERLFAEAEARFAKQRAIEQATALPVPAAAATVTAATIEVPPPLAAPATTSTSVYPPGTQPDLALLNEVVMEGKLTVYRLSRSWDVPVDLINRLNGLKAGVWHPGQRIRRPTILEIDEFYASRKAMSANSEVAPQQPPPTFVIPAPQEAVPTPPPASLAVEAPINTVTISAGENFSQAARRAGVDPLHLAAYNGLSTAPDNVTKGDTFNLPPEGYVPQSGSEARYAVNSVSERAAIEVATTDSGQPDQPVSPVELDSVVTQVALPQEGGDEPAEEAPYDYLQFAADHGLEAAQVAAALGVIGYIIINRGSGGGGSGGGGGETVRVQTVTGEIREVPASTIYRLAEIDGQMQAADLAATQPSTSAPEATLPAPSLDSDPAVQNEYVGRADDKDSREFDDHGGGPGLPDPTTLALLAVGGAVAAAAAGGGRLGSPAPQPAHNLT